MLERIAGIIREQLNLDNVEITEETSFKDDLDADSLDLFELVMAFEEAYNVEIPSEDPVSYTHLTLSAMLWIISEIKKSTLNLR